MNHQSSSLSCELCGRLTPISENIFLTYCCNGASTILRPHPVGQKYVVIICKNRPTYYLLTQEAKTFMSNCCKEFYDITDQIVEIKNGQAVFFAKKQFTHDELQRVVLTDPAAAIVTQSNNNELQMALHREAQTVQLLAAERSKCQALIETVRGHEEHISALRRNAPILEDELWKSQELVQQQIQEIAGLRSALMEKAAEEAYRLSNGENAGLAAQLDALRMEVRDLEGELAEVAEEREGLLMRLDETDGALEEMAEKGYELQAQLEEQERLSDELGLKNSELMGEISQERIGHEKTKEELEMVKKELEKLKNSSNNTDKMMEQITALMATNLNLSTVMTQMKQEGAAKEVEKKTNDEPAKLVEACNNFGPLMVPCDICGVEAEIPEGKWMTYCKERSCTRNVRVILAPVPQGFKIVRVLCKNVDICSRVPSSMKTVKCNCCQREFRITDVVTEIRNNQKVYKTELAALPEDELIRMKNKMKALNDEFNNLEDQHGKAIDELNELRQEKNVFEEKQKTRTAFDEEKKLILKEIEVLEMEKENIHKDKLETEEKMAQLTEINKLLVKKIMDKNMFAEQ